MWGSATLGRELLATGTHDVLRLLQHPVVPGHGPYVFAEPTPASFSLASHRTFASGGVSLDYVPAA